MERAKKILKWIIIILVIGLVIVSLGTVAYTQIATAEADPTADGALLTTTEVQVVDDDWLVFQPVNTTPTTGLIFYPGGLVDPAAYAPYAKDIAAAGYLVAILPMPLNLAILGAGQANEVIEAYPEIDNWAVGGHSLGGVTAAQFIKDNPWAADGLVLWGAYPAAGSDVSCRVLDAVSIYGTRDGLSTPEEILASQPLLPPETTYVAIEGGNHAQFGWYGEQNGDLPAEISHLEQQAQTVTATVKLLEQIESRKAR